MESEAIIELLGAHRPGLVARTGTGDGPVAWIGCSCGWQGWAGDYWTEHFMDVLNRDEERVTLRVQMAVARLRDTDPETYRALTVGIGSMLCQVPLADGTVCALVAGHRAPCDPIGPRILANPRALPCEACGERGMHTPDCEIAGVMAQYQREGR